MGNRGQIKRTKTQPFWKWIAEMSETKSCLSKEISELKKNSKKCFLVIFAKQEP